MVKRCTNCGTVLPINSARFCNKCGVPLSPDPLNSASANPVNVQPRPANGSAQQGDRKDPLREQIAQQPIASRPQHSNVQEPPPSWSFEPDEHVPQLDFSSQASETAGEASFPARATWSAGAQHPVRREQRSALRESRENGSQQQEMPPVSEVAEQHQNFTPAKARQEQNDGVEDLPTRPMNAEFLVSPASQVAPAIPAAAASAAVSPALEKRNAMPSATADKTRKTQSSAKSKKDRGPLLVLVVLCCLFVIAGAISWILAFQPFSVASVTQPQQSFSDRTLGASFLYPAGWVKGIDQTKGMVKLADSSQTAQVLLSVTDAANKDVNQYLKQQATQLGIGGVKTSAPLSFAGATWQQVEGNLQQSGASYTATLIGTIHSGRLYTILQAAPQNVYPDEERVAFSPLRSSFRFL